MCIQHILDLVLNIEDCVLVKKGGLLLWERTCSGSELFLPGSIVINDCAFSSCVDCGGGGGGLYFFCIVTRGT